MQESLQKERSLQYTKCVITIYIYKVHAWSTIKAELLHVREISFVPRPTPFFFPFHCIDSNKRKRKRKSRTEEQKNGVGLGMRLTGDGKFPL